MRKKIYTILNTSKWHLSIFELLESSVLPLDIMLNYLKKNAHKKTVENWFEICLIMMHVTHLFQFTGQMIEALQSGKYDLNKTALIMSQTGGGCRATNYIGFIRKALKDAGFENVPVISLTQQEWKKCLDLN